jgi:RNase_H superfamily
VNQADPATPREEVVLDIETAMDWTTAKERAAHPALQLALFASQPWIAVTGGKDGRTVYWQYHEAADLLEYLSRRTVIGWNTNAFDLPVIQLTAFRQRKKDWGLPLESIDLFERIHRDTRVMFKLEDVARANFDEGKVRSSAEVPKLFEPMLKAKSWKLEAFDTYKTIVEHCERDVLLERMVYDRARCDGLELPEVPPSKYLPEGRRPSTWYLE